MTRCLRLWALFCEAETDLERSRVSQEIQRLIESEDRRA